MKNKNPEESVCKIESVLEYLRDSQCLFAGISNAKRRQCAAKLGRILDSLPRGCGPVIDDKIMNEIDPKSLPYKFR